MRRSRLAIVVAASAGTAAVVLIAVAAVLRLRSNGETRIIVGDTEYRLRGWKQLPIGLSEPERYYDLSARPVGMRYSVGATIRSPWGPVVSAGAMIPIQERGVIAFQPGFVASTVDRGLTWHVWRPNDLRLLVYAVRPRSDGKFELLLVKSRDDVEAFRVYVSDDFGRTWLPEQDTE